MLCLVSEFIPLSELGVKISDLSQDPNDATAALVDDSIWSIFSQVVSDKQFETNSGSTRCVDIHLLKGLLLR